MRYQVLQLLQLFFALSLIFGAFAAGIVVGWWRWGRNRSIAASGGEGRMGGLRSLFSPEDRDDEIVLADLEVDITAQSVASMPRAAEGLVFATAPTAPDQWSPPPWSAPGPPAAIGPPGSEQPANAERRDV